MTDTGPVVAPAGGAPAGATGAAATRTLTIASAAVANFLQMMGATITKSDGKYTITVSNGEGRDLEDGLTKDELTKLGINFTNNRLFDLIGAGTVIGGTNTDNAITAEEAAKFMTNVEEYAKLLGYNITDANREQVLKDVAAMYNKAGVDFRVVNEADQAAVKAAAEVLKGKAAEGQPGAEAYTTWNTETGKTLENTQALARAVLGTKEADGEKLVNDLVSAWWNNILKNTSDAIEEKDLMSLYSFLSFWRNVPDSVLKDWGLTQDLSKYAATPTGITVVNEGMWNTWLSAAAPQAEAPAPAQGTDDTARRQDTTRITNLTANLNALGVSDQAIIDKFGESPYALASLEEEGKEIMEKLRISGKLGGIMDEKSFEIFEDKEVLDLSNSISSDVPDSQAREFILSALGEIGVQEKLSDTIKKVRTIFAAAMRYTQISVAVSSMSDTDRTALIESMAKGFEKETGVEFEKAKNLISILMSATEKIAPDATEPHDILVENLCGTAAE